MSTAEDLLARVRDHTPTKRGKKKVFEQPESSDFGEGVVLAFDQTLTKTGWSLVVHHHGLLGVPDCGVLEARPEGVTGFEETFAKDLLMEERIRRVVMQGSGYRLIAIVHEMPAVKGYRLESSLMAAAAIRRQVRRQVMNVPVVMINRQSAYAALVGAPADQKAKGTATVNRLLAYHRGQRWTQDIHDAVLLGLKHLHTPEEKR